MPPMHRHIPFAYEMLQLLCIDATVKADPVEGFTSPRTALTKPTIAKRPMKTSRLLVKAGCKGSTSTASLSYLTCIVLQEWLCTLC